MCVAPERPQSIVEIEYYQIWQRESIGKARRSTELIVEYGSWCPSTGWWCSDAFANHRETSRPRGEIGTVECKDGKEVVYKRSGRFLYKYVKAHAISDRDSDVSLWVLS